MSVFCNRHVRRWTGCPAVFLEGTVRFINDPLLQEHSMCESAEGFTSLTSGGGDRAAILSGQMWLVDQKGIMLPPTSLSFERSNSHYVPDAHNLLFETVSIFPSFKMEAVTCFFPQTVLSVLSYRDLF